MSLNKRERVLLAVVVALLVIVAGNYVLKNILLGPLEARDGDIAALRQQEQTRRLDWDRFVRDRQRLELWLRQSLPPDANLAQTLYQSWLVELAERSGLQRATVTPNQIAASGDHYHRLPFSLQARGSLRSLANFLYAFFDADLLHQVRRISITPVPQGGMTTLDIGLSVEALSLTEAAPRTTLFPEGGEQRPSGRLAEDDLIAYQQALGRDVFAPFVPQMPRGENTFDTAAYVYLVGVVGVGNRREAWLYDRINNRQYRLRPDGQYAIAGIQMTAREIADRSVILETEDGLWRLNLGTNLREGLERVE